MSVSAHAATNAEFTISHADFWLDPDGKNRWHYIQSPDNPGYGPFHCQACGHFILYQFGIQHESGRTATVGSECVHYLALTADAVERARIEADIARAEKRAKVEKAKVKADTLLNLSRDPSLRLLDWTYHGRTRPLAESLWWYAGMVRNGATYTEFERAIREFVESKGMAWPLGRPKKKGVA